MKLPIGNVIGGVNYSASMAELPPYFLADSQNIVPTETGYATKRGGSTIINSVDFGTVVTSVHEFISNGTSYIFAAADNLIGLYDGFNTFDSHITGLRYQSFGQWVNYGDYAIYANGWDNVKKTDGTTGSDLTSDLEGIRAGQCLAEWGERVWVGGYYGNVATLLGSALRAETDFATSTTSIGYFSGPIGDKNDPITGLFPFFDMLLIGKLNQIWTLTGAPPTNSATFRIDPFFSKGNDNIGFTSKNAIAQVGNDLIFLDGFDIKRLSGITQYGDVGTVSILGSIEEYFRGALDKDYLQYSQFFHYKHKKQIWCTVPTGELTRLWFVLDYSRPDIREALKLPQYSFFPMSGITPYSFGGIRDGSKTLVYAGCSSGKIRVFDTGTNDTNTAIDAYATWGVGDIERTVQAARVNLNIKYSNSCTITPSYAYGIQDWEDSRTVGNFTDLTDQDLTDSSWRTSGGVAGKTLADFYMNDGRGFLFKLRHNTAGETFELKPSVLVYRRKTRYYA